MAVAATSSTYVPTPVSDQVVLPSDIHGNLPKILPTPTYSHIPAVQPSEALLKRVQMAKKACETRMHTGVMKSDALVDLNGASIVLPEGSQYVCHIDKYGKITLLSCFSPNHMKEQGMRNRIGWSMGRSPDRNMQQFGRLLRLPPLEEFVHRILVQGRSVEEVQREVQDAMHLPYNY